MDVNKASAAGSVVVAQQVADDVTHQATLTGSKAKALFQSMVGSGASKNLKIGDGLVTCTAATCVYQWKQLPSDVLDGL